MLCGEAENVSSNLRQKERSLSVNCRSPGSGSIVGRGGVWYCPDGAAQAVSASTHAALSSRKVRFIFLFPFQCICVLGAQLRAQVCFDFARRLHSAIVLFLAISNCGVVALLVLLGPVMTEPEARGQQQDQGQDHRPELPVENAHAAALGRTSYWAMFRPRMTAIRLAA